MQFDRVTGGRQQRAEVGGEVGVRVGGDQDVGASVPLADEVQSEGVEVAVQERFGLVGHPADERDARERARITGL